MTPNTIHCGDTLEILADAPAGSVDLVFADPPYNIGYVYDKYDDDRPDGEFVEWCRKWMAACQRVLKADGSFYIAIGDDFAAELRIIGRKLGMHLRNWIIWHYTFGQNTRTKFCRSHTHILYLTKDPKRFKFNDRMCRFPSARHTEYQDLRANPSGRVPDDVWSDIPRVCGTFKERAGFHGCQLPEALLARIIMVSSMPGDIVLDPFVGSGTTAAVAKRLGRRYIGIDLSPEYAERARARVEAIRDESAAPTAGPDEAWPALHVDFLAQLFRETGVVLENLLPNEAAMRVVTASLNMRASTAYTQEQVAEQLEGMRLGGQLPKIPNDTPFVSRDHRISEGKKYDRRVTRWRGRKRTDAAPSAETPAAPRRRGRPRKDRHAGETLWNVS